MIRVEIIGNIEILYELQDELKSRVPDCHYTILPVLKAYGKRGYAFGDTVWPETNFCCVLYLQRTKNIDTRNKLSELKNICDDIQTSAPQNAITIFAYHIQDAFSKDRVDTDTDGNGSYYSNQ